MLIGILRNIFRSWAIFFPQSRKAVFWRNLAFSFNVEKSCFFFNVNSLSTVFNFLSYMNVFWKVMERLSRRGVNLNRFLKKCPYYYALIVFSSKHVLETHRLMYKKLISFVIDRECPIKLKSSILYPMNNTFRYLYLSTCLWNALSTSFAKNPKGCHVIVDYQTFILGQLSIIVTFNIAVILSYA